MNSSTEKKCSRCHSIQPLVNYDINRRGNPKSTCNSCRKRVIDIIDGHKECVKCTKPLPLDNFGMKNQLEYYKTCMDCREKFNTLARVRYQKNKCSECGTYVRQYYDESKKICWTCHLITLFGRQYQCDNCQKNTYLLYTCKIYCNGMCNRQVIYCQECVGQQLRYYKVKCMIPHCEGTINFIRTYDIIDGTLVTRI